MAWVTEYVRAWHDDDVTGVERLFTEQAHYRPSPYDESEVGHDAIRAFWLDDAGRVDDYEEWAYWPGKLHSAADERL
jgi:hypothetical protein